jgi:hypothetical protein
MPKSKLKKNHQTPQDRIYNQILDNKKLTIYPPFMTTPSPLPEDDLIEAEEELVRKLEYLLTLNQENIL